MNFQMFSDSEGKTSSSRVVYIFVVMVFMIVWGYISMKSGAMVMIDPEWIGILAVFAGQKSSQAFAENRKSNEV